MAATNTISVISYNLRLHTAYHEVAQLAAKHNADIICLQECFAHELTNSVGGLTLAGKTNIGHLALAVYCRAARFTPVASQSHLLPLSLYEQLKGKIRERLLITELYDKAVGKPVFVASFHATNLMAPNRLRRRQIQYAFLALTQLSGPAPVILIGDYNYPLFQQRLRRFIYKQGYQAVISKSRTFKNDYFIGTFDFASVANVSAATAMALPHGISDHAPVLVEVKV